ncbi:MAG: ATP-dependent DNA helicase RecG [Patescibacteria group bacterium]|mgnify:CR=1 FL=1
MSARPITTWVDARAPLETWIRIAPSHRIRLEKLGIKNARDLLWHLPHRYQDFGVPQSPAAVRPGDTVTCIGVISSIANAYIFPRRMTATEAVLEDAGERIRVRWFHQSYLIKTLPEGTRVRVAGKAYRDKKGVYLASPTYEVLLSDNTGPAPLGLVPVYSETEGITSRSLHAYIKKILALWRVPDPLPEKVQKEQALPSLGDALHMVHTPDTSSDAKHGRERLAFDDVLALHIGALQQRRITHAIPGIPIPPDHARLKQYISKLPMKLTDDQRVALFEIITDMERPFPMNRLLQGDVGSGKTIVALLAATHTIHAGHHAVLLAPTDALARQHAETAERIQDILGIQTALITAQETRLNGRTVSKVRARVAIKGKTPYLIIGTHALMAKGVSMPHVGLAIIDEQHRFGVDQRRALIATARRAPHLLALTATPIPRTLALTILGDLDISTIRTKPAGRSPIMTHIIAPKERAKAMERMRSLIRDGAQAFFISPRIHEGMPGEDAPLEPALYDLRAAKKAHAVLAQDVFPEFSVSLIHGRMKPAERSAAMAGFRDGWHHVLVATTLIEVGIDVPNARIIAIEHADHFGLAQLHQLRGRVGRGEGQSHCFLFASSQEKIEHERLTLLASCDDGFELAEHDLKLRGAGQFFGFKQSGTSDLQLALSASSRTVTRARDVARVLLHEDPRLAHYPELKARVAEVRAITHPQ